MRNALPLIPLLCTPALAGPGTIGHTVAADTLGNPLNTALALLLLAAHARRVGAWR